MKEIDIGGRPPKVLTNTDIIQVEALSAVCTKSQMASYFGMTEKTFRAVEKRQPEVLTAYRRGRAKAIVEVATSLYQKAIDGDMRAAQFYLKTQAGWSEKSHIELSRAEEPEDRTWTVRVVEPDGGKKISKILEYK